MYEQATLECYVVVNGHELRPQPGAAFSGTFVDHAHEPYRTQYCN